MIERNQYKHGVLESAVQTHKLFYPRLVQGPTKQPLPFLPPNPIVHIACWDIGTSGYAAGVAKGRGGDVATHHTLVYRVQLWVIGLFQQMIV